jgi:predicted ATP-binding protein involved in virulence
MLIRYFEVDGLLNRSGTIKSELHPDLNIITGRNGAGKTSLLKLLWYVVSGNILLALREVPFKRIKIITDAYECTVYRLGNVNCKVDFKNSQGTWTFNDQEDDEEFSINPAEDAANPMLIESGSSIFFPTFRRIEGGFTTNSARARLNPINRASNIKSKSEIESALEVLSSRLSNGRNLFISAISTSDIVGLLLTQYTNLNDKYNEKQKHLSDQTILTIKEFKSDNKQVKNLEKKAAEAGDLLDKIRLSIEELEKDREKIMAPIEVVRELIEKLFKYSGISIGSRLNFGDAANSVNSDSLSAGEKQMLSFICYNAFHQNSTVIIDEPELSLHVDWQRQLFPTLLSQRSSNQFLIATHSPFIYSKYPDKEIIIDLDRGDTEV